MMRRLYLIIYIVACCIFSVHAQNTEEQLRSIYESAEEDYNIGRLEEAQQQLNSKLAFFPNSLLQSAYRLLALCSLGLDDDDKAEEYTKLLLNENPYYSTTINDPQRFIDMVERIKSGQIATITTASSQAESLSEVPVPTTLITEEMIRNSGARNLQEVLAAYLAGMNVVDCNDDINIAMRGIYSNGQEKILIMLNGHRLNSYATNIAAPDYSISLDKVHQIEVLRGPASSLYGGVALTAVVNVITKQGADVDGVEARVGIGNYGQLEGGMVFGKRYFDLDIIAWGHLYKAKGENVYIPLKDTGMQMTDGNITIGGIGPKPSYDTGIQMKYGNLQFFYNATFSQVISPFTMTYTFSPYTREKYHTFDGYYPSFVTRSQHTNLSYGQQLGNVFLRGTVSYDNSDLTHYQVLNEPVTSVMLDVLPVPSETKKVMDGCPGISRYINGQEHTISGKVLGDWTYIKDANYQGQLTFGAEYSYFQLDDVQYIYGYDFTKLSATSDSITSLGRGHESNMNGFFQFKQHLNSFIVNAGLRFDYKNRYDDTKIREFSPRLALIYLQPKWNLKLSYSKSFIDAPYLYRKTNLILSSIMNFQDNDDDNLQPEILHSFQLTFGANQWLPGFNFEINGFYNRARDIIYQYVAEHYNTGNYDTYGVELTASYENRRFTAHANAAWQSVSRAELFDQNFGHSLSTPDFTANALLAWQFTKHFKLRSHIDFKSRQHVFYIDIYQYGIVRTWNSTLNKYKEEYKVNPDPELKIQIDKLEKHVQNAQDETPVYKEISPRVIFNLGLTYQWRKLTLDLDVKNLFNKHYVQSGVSTGLIPQKGRWFMCSIAYKF